MCEAPKTTFPFYCFCLRIDVLESVEFGKFLALDGDILFSEKDEFIYDEMVTHVPMAARPDVRHVLIIGGGDGGVAKELTQYDSIEKIDVWSRMRC